jgi:hypothetical protein
VTDLLAERRKRHRDPMHFRTAAEALDFAAYQLQRLRIDTAGQMLVLADDLSLPLDQALAVVVECQRLHERFHEVGP